MVKVDLITGFLGSGKTTFIRKYAQYLMDMGNNIGILENDYGAVNVDMMLLQDLMGDNCELEMISGGCDKDCHRRRFKTKLIAMGMCGYDRVLVEPSGIFDVDEFFDILHEEPLNRWYQIGNVIAIVDSKLESDLSDEADFILASEVADAGCIMMSKCQDASSEEIQETVEHVNLALEKVHCSRRFRCSVDGMRYHAYEAENEGDRVSSGKAGDKADAICKSWDEMSKEDFDRIASCGYEMSSYRKPEFEAEDAFTSLYFMNVRMPEKELREAAEKILSDPECGNVFRMKGFMKVDDECCDRDSDGMAAGVSEETVDRTDGNVSRTPEHDGLPQKNRTLQEQRQHWIELNATRNEVTIRPLHVGQEVLIVIGEELQEARIRSYLKI